MNTWKCRRVKRYRSDSGSLHCTVLLFCITTNGHQTVWVAVRHPHRQHSRHPCSGINKRACSQHIVERNRLSDIQQLDFQEHYIEVSWYTNPGGRQTHTRAYSPRLNNVQHMCDPTPPSLLALLSRCQSKVHKLQAHNMCRFVYSLKTREIAQELVIKHARRPGCAGKTAGRQQTCGAS